MSPSLTQLTVTQRWDEGWQRFGSDSNVCTADFDILWQDGGRRSGRFPVIYSQQLVALKLEAEKYWKEPSSITISTWYKLHIRHLSRRSENVRFLTFETSWQQLCESCGGMKEASRPLLLLLEKYWNSRSCKTTYKRRALLSWSTIKSCTEQLLRKKPFIQQLLSWRCRLDNKLPPTGRAQGLTQLLLFTGEQNNLCLATASVTLRAELKDTGSIECLSLMLCTPHSSSWVSSCEDLLPSRQIWRNIWVPELLTLPHNWG